MKNIAKEAIKARVIDVKITWVSKYKKVQIGQLQLDTHVIARQLRDNKARGEPITIENFVIDTIKFVINEYKKKYSDVTFSKGRRIC